MSIRIAVSRFASIMAVASVLLPASTRLHAQAQSSAMTSAQAAAPAAVVDQLLGKVEEQLVPLAEAMPADKYSFAPKNGNFQGVANFGDQLRHVAMANYSMFGDAASLQPQMPKAGELKTKEQIVSALKQSFVFAHRAIGTLTPDNALQKVKPADGIDTRAGIMLFAIVHMNDHYGQLVEYVRANGIVPPASRPHGAR